MLPIMNEYARISQIHYRYQQGENKEKQDAYATKKLSRLGYNLDANNTNKDVLTATKGDKVHINYTGTNINNPRDLLSDVALGTGTQRSNPQFKQRRQKTRDIMRQYGDDKEYSLGGHSLGGSIALNTISQSQSIRDRVKEVHVFNPGYTKLFHESIQVDKPTKRDLNKKVNIHRVNGDIVSAHAHKETAFGNLFEYKHEDKNSDLSDKHSLDTFIEQEL